MKVLVACEESQTVCKAFRKLGHEAYSCDVQDQSGGKPEWHIKDDVLKHLDGWDLIIAHPPCTYLTNAGVRHLHDHVTSRNGNQTKVCGSARWVAMFEAAEFFNAIKEADCPRICIENPIPHKYSRALIGNYTQLIQPWHFGHRETKATCLWLKGLPKLKPTYIVGPPKNEQERKVYARMHRMSPSKDRAKLRSKTYQGIADAMADQWGNQK